MKFIVSRNELYKNLSAISGVLSTNNTMQILDNFLFTIKGNTLTVTASDLDCTMSAEIELNNVDGEGSIAVPSKNILETLKLIGETPIVFSTYEDGENITLKFTAAEGEYVDHCFSGKEYPDVTKQLSNSLDFEIEASLLHKAISKTLFATSNDELRQNMMGVFCELNNESITFVATDAHKLVKFRSKAVTSPDPASFILPKKPLQQLKNVVAGLGEKVRVAYSQESNYIRFSFGNIVLYSSLKEGKYPNYNAVIPKDNEKTFVVSRDLFLQSIRRVGIYANQSTYQIRITLSSDSASIMGEDIDFSKRAQENIIGTYSGEPMEIGFNAKFLRDILDNIDTAEVQMNLKQSNRAALLCPYGQTDDDDEYLLMLIMPVMLNY